MSTAVIAIPAFNEASTVRRIVEAARAHGPVLVIDDGSTDGTGDAARAGGATVIRHARRLGKGAALATAVGAARDRGASLLITLDADGQHDPADVPALHAAALAAPRAIVVGSRPESALSRGRGLAIQLAGYWVNWITGHAVADTQSGFRVYPVALFDEVRLRGGRFVFETAVLVDALRNGCAVREVPIRAVAYAERPSRFHPIGDGAAITGYLVSHALARWAVELRDAVAEVAAVFSRERRRARHGRMLAKSSVHAGMPTWGPALGIAFVDEVHGRFTSWWRHPRSRRARVAARATLASPAVLALAAASGVAGGGVFRVLERVIDRVYDQRALPCLESGACATRLQLESGARAPSLIEQTGARSR